MAAFAQAAPRRAASTKSAVDTAESKAKETADKAKEAASNAADKAKAQAGNAADAAKSYLDKAQASGSKILGQIEQRAGGLLGSYREPIVYNLAVVREIGKQVYINEKLAPPTNLQTIRSAYEDFYRKASDASWWRSIFESGDWKRIALYALEAYGIFTIGEMIGRR
ncbi:hypothetical protein P389DRAFT_146072 [Cystobasidium minutum MCA 4210]|uniref:uncharacterized protein n=1 Tax=Cystobasidium minutum MCA 4210 TaxID=1397322 RepID=UPI0034CD9B86|eukprot:jgi/Rhomi1/146072/e_gw1.6.182.1